MSAEMNSLEINANVISTAEGHATEEPSASKVDTSAEGDALDAKASPSRFSNIEFTLPAKQARDAWRAVAAVNDHFCLTLSESCVRFSATNDQCLDLRCTIDPSLKPQLGSIQLSFDVETKGLAALGVIDFEGDVTFKFPDIDLSVGSTGPFNLTIADAFTVNWDYLLTSAAPALAQPHDDKTSECLEEGRLIDPRVLRALINGLRNFAAEENVTGSDFTAMRVEGGSIRAGTHGAACEIESAVIGDISFSIEKNVGRSVGTILGLLAPERTTLCVNGGFQKLSDGRLTLCLRQGGHVPKFPMLSEPFVRIHSDGFVFDEALTRIRAQIKNQKQTDQALVELLLSPNDKTLTFATAVNGGLARVKASIRAEADVVEPTSLKFFHYLLEKLDVSIQTGVEISLSPNGAMFIQKRGGESCDNEGHRTVISTRREKKPSDATLVRDPADK
jgi:hypothetical protein